MDEDNQYCPGIIDIGEAICELLAENIKELTWSVEVKGPALGNKPAGTVTADHIVFSGGDKGEDLGTITFILFFIVPDQRTLALEDITMKAREVLIDHADLDGMVQDSFVKEINYGTAPGMRGANPGAATMTYEVQAWF